MNHDILGPDGSKAVAAMLADPLWKARGIGLELQIRPLLVHQLSQIGNTDHPAHLGHLVAPDVHGPAHHIFQRVRRILLYLQPDNLPAPPPFDGALIKAHEIFRLFLDFDVAIADDPKGALPQIFEPGKNQVKKPPQHLLHRNGAHPAARKSHKARQHGRKHQKRRHMVPVTHPLHLENQRESLVGNKRKGVRRINGLRGQHRKNLV